MTGVQTCALPIYYSWYLVTGVIVVVLILLLLLLLRLANIKLKDSEVRHRSLIENIPGMTYRCKNDNDWTMLFASEQTEGITGYPAEEFLSHKRSYSIIIHPDDIERVEQSGDDDVDARQP